jgi:hypothetical protein
LTEGFKVPTCVCGCAEGDHASAGSGFSTIPSYGRCGRCDCTRFRDRDELVDDLETFARCLEDEA